MADDALDPATRERYAALCKRIREKCPAIRLAYPPATEEQLLAIEQALGFPLPPFLRTYYEKVSNGGYGPGWLEMIGAQGGAAFGGHTIDTWQYYQGNWRLLEDIAMALRLRRGSYIRCEKVPHGFLAIADDRCEGRFVIDALTGGVYRYEYGGAIQDYEILNGGSISKYGKVRDVVALQFVTESLEEIMESYLEEVDFAFHSLWPDGTYELRPEMLDPIFVVPAKWRRPYWPDPTYEHPDSEDWRWYQTLQPTNEP